MTIMMIPRSALATMMRSSSISPLGRRCLATQRVQLSRRPEFRWSPAVLDALPDFEGNAMSHADNDKDQLSEEISSLQQPLFLRTPITSAHCIDFDKQAPSVLDSAAFSPTTGSVVHGQYGDLGTDVAASIPLEYLALLRPAAEGAAALRMLLNKSSSKTSTTGTLLVYGASLASGWAVTQLAANAGHAVVGVVSGEHSGNYRWMECVKGMIPEPGTAVPEEYALAKRNFADLVQSIVTGDDGTNVSHNAEDYLKDFKENLLNYAEAYPDTRPAAVSARALEFQYMEKDRETFEANMLAYLHQFPPGSPPMDSAKLDAFFTTEQYQIFRDKFWKQTTDVISGVEFYGVEAFEFSPPHIVRSMIETSETLDRRTYPGAGPEVSYAFNILTPPSSQYYGDMAKPAAGGPMLGAIMCLTPNLITALEKVAAASSSSKKNKRSVAEALQFLTHAQRAAYTAARSVVAQAAGAPIVVLGGSSSKSLETLKKSLPAEWHWVGKPTEADVQEALRAMDVDETGHSRLNYFVQVYRANDFPFYQDYAVHRASEPLAGPRQIIVTK